MLELKYLIAHAKILPHVTKLKKVIEHYYDFSFVKSTIVSFLFSPARPWKQLFIYIHIHGPFLVIYYIRK